jgi:hypothetical protein
MNSSFRLSDNNDCPSQFGIRPCPLFGIEAIELNVRRDDVADVRRSWELQEADESVLLLPAHSVQMKVSTSVWAVK